MARDPLSVLLRLRGLALDTARRALAERMAAEADAAARSDALRHAVAAETACQAAQPAQPWLAEAHAAWQERMRLAQHDAAAFMRRSGEATAAARAGVQAARVEVRTLEAMRERQAVERRAAAARKEQAALDEAGGAARPMEERRDVGTMERVTGIEPA